MVDSRLKKKKLFLFDIDGTIAVDETVFDGTMDLLSHIRKIGGKSIYITNNSTKSRADYAEKFQRMGIQAAEEDFITASYAACRYLKEHHSEDRIYVAGTRSLVEELKREGLHVTTDGTDPVQVVLVGYDSELTYGKLVDVCRYLMTNPSCVYLATNPDLCCPTGFGSVPDCGAICGMIACAAGRMPLYLGKPNPVIVEYSLIQTGFSKDETIVVGDRLYTDIAVGIAAEVDTAVVFTGEAKKDDIKSTEYPPTWAFDSVRQLADLLNE
ncbi:MAG: HAD-IIA family hydrolase [Lachnospiraceae bacterium]|nr:HAD-IIA family hydrolase [Candidatus Fimimorpha excrementavium]